MPPAWAGPTSRGGGRTGSLLGMPLPEPLVGFGLSCLQCACVQVLTSGSLKPGAAVVWWASLTPEAELTLCLGVDVLAGGASGASAGARSSPPTDWTSMASTRSGWSACLQRGARRQPPRCPSRGPPQHQRPGSPSPLSEAAGAAETGAQKLLPEYHRTTCCYRLKSGCGPSRCPRLLGSRVPLCGSHPPPEWVCPQPCLRELQLCRGTFYNVFVPE